MTTEQDKATESAEPVAIVNEAMGGIEWLQPYKPEFEDRPLYFAASEAKPTLPAHIARKAQEAIDAATNPKGMQTNGPAYAKIEASLLTALLRYASAPSEAKATGDHDFPIALVERIRQASATMGIATQESLEACSFNLADLLYKLCGAIERMHQRAKDRASEARTAVPEGYALVPIEPTEEMIQAGCLSQSVEKFESYEAWWDSHSSGVSERIRRLLADDYRTMIAAAPSPALDASKVRLIDTLREVREALQFANDSLGGGINDTIWMMHRPETLFDFIDAALDEFASPAQQVTSAAREGA